MWTIAAAIPFSSRLHNGPRNNKRVLLAQDGTDLYISVFTYNQGWLRYLNRGRGSIAIAGLLSNINYYALFRDRPLNQCRIGISSGLTWLISSANMDTNCALNHNVFTHWPMEARKSISDTYWCFWDPRGMEWVINTEDLFVLPQGSQEIEREKGWRIMRCTAGDYRQVTSFCLKHVIGAIMLLLFYYSILFGNSWRSELSLIITLFCLIFKRLPQKGYIQIEKGKRYQHQPTIDPAHTSAHAYCIYPVSTLRCMI